MNRGTLAGEPYGHAFDARPGTCFRMVYGRANLYPERCWREVTTHGTFVDRRRRRHRVDACDRHASELARRVRQ